MIQDPLQRVIGRRLAVDVNSTVVRNSIFPMESLFSFFLHTVHWLRYSNLDFVSVVFEKMLIWDIFQSNWLFPDRSSIFECYCLVDKYMRQPPPLGSGVRCSS
jgi:hypothetical protein